MDHAECTGCDGCLAVCPEVFSRNADTGLIEVADLEAYPEACVDEAVKLCPCRCIAWEGE